MYWTREQLEALKQYEAETEMQMQEKDKTQLYFCYGDDLL